MTKNKKHPTRSTMEMYEESRKMSIELSNELSKIKPKCQICGLPATREAGQLINFKYSYSFWCDKDEPKSAANLKATDMKNAPTLRRAYKWLEEHEKLKEMLLSLESIEKKIKENKLT